MFELWFEPEPTFSKVLKEDSALKNEHSKPVRLSFIFRTQIKLLLMNSGSFRSLQSIDSYASITFRPRKERHNCDVCYLCEKTTTTRKKQQPNNNKKIIYSCSSVDEKNA